MTAPPVRPGRAPRRASTTAALRPAKGTGLLALCLVASTGIAAVGAVPAAGATPTVELSRVVVGTLGAGAAGVAAAAAAVAAAGGTVLDHLPLVGGVSADLPTGATLAPGLVVVPDREVQLATAATSTTASPSTVRSALGLGAPAGQGRGVTIAVVDTGVDEHADLAGRVTHVDLTGTTPVGGPYDGYGHGTFVAGVAAGDGSSSGGTYAGVAPGAQVLDVRVADAEGNTDLVTVLRGLETAHQRGADVVNLSLSSYSPLPWQIDPLTVALTRMWESGTVVVVPAGNDGPEAGSVTSPGVAPALLTVGALDTRATDTRVDDAVADFSARGPAPQEVAKPELVAPGRSVVSLRAPGSLVDGANPSAQVDGGYFKGSGTSFSTAVTSGAAAVLRAAKPHLSPDQVKSMLTSTAVPTTTADVAAEGAGAIDVVAAAGAPVPADATCSAPGKGKKARACLGGATAVPGPPGLWKQFVDALAAGDAAGAASSWSRLPADVHAWVASSWSALPPELRAAMAEDWVGHGWSHGSPEEWAQREWAGRSWAASSWSGRSWAGSSWSGRSWAGRSWAGRSWAGENWATSTWHDDAWAAQWGS